MPFIRYTLALLLLFTVGCADTADREATADSDPTDNMADVADDLAALDTPAVETLLQNDLVHVHRVTLAPGDSIPPHEGGERVVYALTDLPSLVFETDGVREERSFAASEVHRHDPGVHSVTNAGGTEAEFVVFERRDGMMAAGDAPGTADASTEGVTDEVVLDDAFAEVHRVTLQPGAQLPPHQGYARAIYSLSGYTVEFAGPDGTRDERFEAGQAHYHEPGDHTVENAGDTVAEFLVVEFKR